jgi:hypothetical protein
LRPHIQGISTLSSLQKQKITEGTWVFLSGPASPPNSKAPNFVASEFADLGIFGFLAQSRKMQESKNASPLRHTATT